MRGMVGALVCAVLMLFAGEAKAAKLIAVLPLDVSNTKGKLDKAGQASMEEMLRDVATNALRPLGWTILSGENTIQVLIDNGVKPEECGSQSCHLANARELKAEAFISGTVQFVEGDFVASIRLIETKTGTLLTSERVRAKSVNSLVEAFEAKATGFFEKSGLFRSAGSLSSPATETVQPPPVVETTRPQVRKSKVSEAVGILTITAKPKDAVRLELTDPKGKQLVSGSPYENRAAPPGIWTVHAKASGCEEESQEVLVPVDDMVLVKFDLKPLGALSVKGEPVGASVIITGPHGFKDEGGLPWEATELKRGVYTVRVARFGYIDVEKSIEVKAGEEATLQITMQKEAELASLKSSQSPATGRDSDYAAGIKLVTLRDLHTTEAECLQTIKSFNNFSPEAQSIEAMRSAAAMCRFYLLESRFKDYLAFRFRSDRTLGADLKKKTDLRRELAAEYLNIINIREPTWTLAAMNRLGHLTHNLAHSVREAPIPKGLDFEQKDLYLAQIEDKVIEIDAPAATIFEELIRKAEAEGINNEWTQEAARVLREIRRDR